MPVRISGGSSWEFLGGCRASKASPFCAYGALRENRAALQQGSGGAASGGVQRKSPWWGEIFKEIKAPRAAEQQSGH